MQCVANTLFLTLEQVFGRIKSLSVYRSMLTGTFFLHENFVPPQEVASLLQQGGIAAALRLRGIQYRVSIALI